MAFSYYSPQVVQTGQVPSTQTNFPRLVLITDNRFRTVGNGGHVQSANGYDIRPYSDSGLTSALTFELVAGTYNATTGFFEMWVLIPSLADGNTIYMGYGDPSITTDGSSPSTWPSQFQAVVHMPNGSSLTVNDSTSNARNSTNNGATATSGAIDGGAALNGSSQDIAGIASNNYGLVNAATYSVIALTSSTHFARTFTFERVSGSTQSAISSGEGAGGADSNDGKPGFIYRNSSNSFSIIKGSASIADGVFHWLKATISGTNVALFVDGVSVATASDANNANSFTFASNLARIGSFEASSNFWNGKLDEWRIENTAASANWITTEYNNQSAPGTFAVLGTEVPVGGSSKLFTQSLLNGLGSGGAFFRNPLG